MVDKYFIFEGSITDARGELKEIKGSSGMFGTMQSSYACFMHLNVEIDDRTYKVPINGSWPFEAGNNIRLYLPKHAPLDSHAPEEGGRDRNEEELRKRDTLKPEKIEKIVDGKIVFVYEDIYPY